VAFGLAGWLMLGRLPAAVSLLLAAACWLAVAVGLYVVFRAEHS